MCFLIFRKRFGKTAEIYSLLLKRYGLNADECVFIDDLKENIEAAKALGIHGIVFETYEQAVRDLNELI